MTERDIHEAFMLVSKSGHLYWRIRPVSHFKNKAEADKWNKRYAGFRVRDNKASNDYREVWFMGRKVYTHRIAYMLAHGDLPKGHKVDHINRNTLDNRPENLRLATTAQNAWNRGISRVNTTGVTGVYYEPKVGKYRALIRYEGKLIYLGRSESMEEAVVLRRAAEREYFGQYAPSKT